MSSTPIDAEHEQHIAAYLTEHADFFARHPQALNAQHLPHATDGVTSLFDRQIRQLREQNRHYRTQLAALLQVARENDLIAQRLHHLTLSLVGIRNIDDLMQILPNQVQTVFQADAVAMKLFAVTTLQTPDKSPLVASFYTFLRQAQPGCGAISAEQSDYLFANQTMRSVVLMPLQSADRIGVLAVGSCDETRFNAEQGLDFLHRLNEIVNMIL
jgi:uncharacterized protein YigA (DUF484 family)